MAYKLRVAPCVLTMVWDTISEPLVSPPCVALTSTKTASKSDAVSQKNSCSEPKPLVRTNKRRRRRRKRSEFDCTLLEMHFSVLAPHKETLGNLRMVFFIHNCSKEAVRKLSEGVPGIG